MVAFELLIGRFIFYRHTHFEWDFNLLNRFEFIKQTLLLLRYFSERISRIEFIILLETLFFLHLHVLKVFQLQFLDSLKD